MALDDLRSQWLEPLAWGGRGLRGLVWNNSFRFGRFLMGVRDLIQAWTFLLRRISISWVFVFLLIISVIRFL